MAATGTEPKIYETLITYAGDVAVALGFDRTAGVSYPNVGFKPPRSSDGKLRKPYLALTYLPNGTDLDGLPFDSDETHIGLLQVSVFWPAGEGIVKPGEVAAKVVKAFAPGTRIPGPGLVIHIDRKPTVPGSLQESDLVQIPVTIPWRASVDAA